MAETAILHIQFKKSPRAFTPPQAGPINFKADIRVHWVELRNQQALAFANAYEVHVWYNLPGGGTIDNRVRSFGKGRDDQILFCKESTRVPFTNRLVRMRLFNRFNGMSIGVGEIQDIVQRLNQVIAVPLYLEDDSEGSDDDGDDDGGNDGGNDGDDDGGNDGGNDRRSGRGNDRRSGGGNAPKRKGRQDSSMPPAKRLFPASCKIRPKDNSEARSRAEAAKDPPCLGRVASTKRLCSSKIVGQLKSPAFMKFVRHTLEGIPAQQIIKNFVDVELKLSAERRKDVADQMKVFEYLDLSTRYSSGGDFKHGTVQSLLSTSEPAPADTESRPDLMLQSLPTFHPSCPMARKKTSCRTSIEDVSKMTSFDISALLYKELVAHWKVSTAAADSKGTKESTDSQIANLGGCPRTPTSAVESISVLSSHLDSISIL